MKRACCISMVSVLALALASTVHRAPALAQGPTAVAPYTLSVFARSVTGQYTKPDSIAVLGSNVFVAYGNDVSTTGSDGKTSTIVEYSLTGNVVTTFTVPGHNDGLRVDPATNQLWALSNEDGNPELAIVDPATGAQRVHTFTTPPHGGGYDDIAFSGGQIFISASNPANNPNNEPAIVSVSGKIKKKAPIAVGTVLMGNATATDIVSGQQVTLNLQDPDSMIFDPLGDLVLDSQADAELVIVHNIGASQSVFRLPLTMAGAPVQVDDTIFATSSKGLILVADRDGETVYSITKAVFAPNDSYTAVPTAVGAVDFNTGIVTPIAIGLVSPHGMAFVAQ